jgi:hypothetical protein
MWTISVLPDPLLGANGGHRHHHHHSHGHDQHTSPAKIPSAIANAKISLKDLFGDNNNEAFQDLLKGGRSARVSVADFVARHINDLGVQDLVEIDGQRFQLEPLDKALNQSRRRKTNANKTKYPPYVLERSDVWCSQDNELHVIFRIVVARRSAGTYANDESTTLMDEEKKTEENVWELAAKALVTLFLTKGLDKTKLMQQVACVVLQERLRSRVSELKAVAFVADNSILPRKSGTSEAPMASPPAVPFAAPQDSTMTQELTVEMGSLAKYLPSPPVSTSVSMRGLLVPAGITLICGGGYHGKSTLLQTIAAGIYDKIPGDGREFCVAVPDAVTVRAEDGRYVNNCNISAFISNLPTPPGVTKTLDTSHFSTRDSSGSTSQAANVSEAIEMGTTAMLVDEDVSAANFMARDGRMRALVMDESITPLLYRVNGLYNSHGISSVVVVGGVGDWLDIPHQVILLDKYVASDATKKAQSISYQFSYGHVQYGGKGVVHRLEWEKSGTPIPRRPTDAFAKRYSGDIGISILDGGHALSLHEDYDEQQGDDAMEIVTAADDDDEGCIEASRLEQLVGRKQLFGCGLCVLWVLRAAPKHPSMGLPGLLAELDKAIDEGGMIQVLRDVMNPSDNDGLFASTKWKYLLEEVGFAHRPRKYEVGQALTRMYGIQLEEMPVEFDDSEEIAKRQAEERRQALLKIWENRRNKS